MSADQAVALFSMACLGVGLWLQGRRRDASQPEVTDGSVAEGDQNAPSRESS